MSDTPLGRVAYNRRTSSRSARKRTKVTRACDVCKARKKACTGDVPCRFCERLGAECTYNLPYHRGTASSPLASTRPFGNTTPLFRPQHTSRQSNPVFSGPIAADLTPDSSIEAGGQYRGPASAHSFLDRAVRTLDRHHGSRLSVASASEGDHASIFSYGDRQAAKVPHSLMEWPDRSTAESLLRRYFEFASPTYRILHQGTTERWIDILFGEESRISFSEEPSPGLSLSARAILLLQCAIASLSAPRDEDRRNHRQALAWQRCEAYYQMAELLLAQETGMPTLESVQARFLTVLYFLGTSRINQSWFSFGPTVQLLMVIGLHRKNARFNSIASDVIATECSKRLLWCSFTLDQYLSLILGRPRLLHEKDIDQGYPSLVNDEKLDPSQHGSHLPRNCLMDAPVSHMKLARILARASQDLYPAQAIGKDQELDVIRKLMSSISQWQSELPPLLSDLICASSLASTFQRQLHVIRLARYHAVMFVTRPLLLRDFSQQRVDRNWTEDLYSCINTAYDTLQLVLELADGKQLFTAFWYTQYVTFNALSVMYIYLINIRKGRIPHNWLFEDTLTSNAIRRTLSNLFELEGLTEKAQYYLGEATERNSLAWRYTTVLDILRSEACGKSREQGRTEFRCATDTPLSRNLDSNAPPGLDDPTNDPHHDSFIYEQQQMGWENVQSPLTGSTNFDIQDSSTGYIGTGNPFSFTGTSDIFSLDFWPQLDRLPTCMTNGLQK